MNMPDLATSIDTITSTIRARKIRRVPQFTG